MGQSISEPTGSWKESAESYVFDDKTAVLIANLRTKNGTYKEASVNVTHDMKLDNNDGKFVVKSRGYYDSNVEKYSTVEPAGNWRQTATDVQFDNGVLSANLRKADGSYCHSVIVVLDGHIVENNNGVFKGVGKYGELYLPKQRYVQCPLGSWVDSADNISIRSYGNKYNLTADLKTSSGGVRRSSIEYTSQYDMFDNDNGNFKYVGNCKSKFRL